jgi:hypothetical protein
MLSSGANVIIWEEIISSGAYVIMLQKGANVIIWCYLVMLSSGMITPPFFIFPENFTHSLYPCRDVERLVHQLGLSDFSNLFCTVPTAPIVQIFALIFRKKVSNAGKI